MSRLALHVAPKREPAPEPWLTIADLTGRLQASRSKIERDVEAGLPCIDIGRHDPRRRMKRSLRFSWPAVLAWYGAQR